MKRLINILRPKTLQWQLLSKFFIIITVLLLVIETSQYLSMKNYLENSRISELQLKFHNINLLSLSKYNSAEDVKKNNTDISKKLIDKSITVSIIDGNGNVIDTTVYKNIIDIDRERKDNKEKENPPKEIAVPRLSKKDYINILKEKENIERIFKYTKDENNITQLLVWRKIGSLDSPCGLIQISTPIDNMQDLLHRQILIYLGASILFLLIGTLLGTTVFKKVLVPLYKMTSTVEQINIKQLNTRLPENNGQLEIDKLSGSFNNMLSRIEVSFENEQQIKEKMRQFVSDASHELKTPLTSIHGFVEVLLRGAAKNEAQLNMALNSILLESERLTKLVNDLLILTKLDQHIPIEMHKEDLNAIVEEIVPQLNILLGERKLNLYLEEKAFANVNKNQVKQIIYNLFHNAIQHTDKKLGIITISSSTEKLANSTYGILKISDNGSGIPEKDLNLIFDRFFRSETHRSRAHGGYGLGLSIVKSIVDAHDAKIKVDSNPGIGTTFSILFKTINEVN